MARPAIVSAYGSSLNRNRRRLICIGNGDVT
jgi:hypothetical protein